MSTDEIGVAALSEAKDSAYLEAAAIHFVQLNTEAFVAHVHS